MSTVACVFAHPDDEALGPGGTIAQLARAGQQVHIICCTDGDHQNNGLKHVRDKELLTSAKILGVKRVTFLGYIDGELSNNKYPALARDIKKHLDRLRPHTVVTFDPNGLSGHLDHIAVTSIINHLFPQLSYLKKIMYYTMKSSERRQISNYFVYMPPGKYRRQVDEIIDISAVWNTKAAAMRAHHSQKSDYDRALSIQSRLPKEEWFLIRTK